MSISSFNQQNALYGASKGITLNSFSDAKCVQFTRPLYEQQITPSPLVSVIDENAFLVSSRITISISLKFLIVSISCHHCH